MKSIFVSSTFKDMQFERDTLHLFVLPEIRNYLAKYEESVYFVDLRWGVNTTNLDTDEGASKVLSVCLEQIDECRPYMIVFIGERYGWIPRLSIVQDSIKNKEILTLNENLSVTALEIEYGILNKYDLSKRCLFYFRKDLDKSKMNDEDKKIYSCESVEAEIKNKELKRKIKELYPDKIREYSADYNPETRCLEGLDDLAIMLKKDIKNLLDQDIKETLYEAWQDKEIRKAEFYLSLKSKSMFHIRDIVYTYINEIKNNNLLIIKGQSGLGKSTIVGKIWYLIKNEIDVIPFISGNSERSSSLFDLLNICIYSLEKRLMINKNYDNFIIDELIDYFTELCIKYEESNLQNLVILIDAIDQLNYNEYIESLKWLPKTKLKKIHFAISCLEKTKIPNILPYAGSSKTDILNPLTKTEIKEVIDGILKDKCKEISDIVIENIINKKGTDSPLYLSMLIQRFLMFNNKDYLFIRNLGDDMLAINNYMIKVIDESPEKLTLLAANIIKLTAERFNYELVINVMNLLAFTRNGLRAIDLEQIMKNMNKYFTYLELEEVLKYLDFMFIKRNDGRIDFSHKNIRSGIAVVADKELYNKHILSYIKSLPEGDELRKTELIYHAYLAKDCDTIMQYIINSKQKEQFQIAAKTIQNFTVKDNGSLLIKMFNEEASKKFKHFLVEYLYYQYGTSRSQILLNLRIMESALKIYNKLPIDELFYSRVAKLKIILCKYNDGIELLEKIINSYHFKNINKIDFIIETYSDLINCLLKVKRIENALDYSIKLMIGIDLLITNNGLHKSDINVLKASNLYAKALIKHKDYIQATIKTQEILNEIDTAIIDKKELILSYINNANANVGLDKYNEAYNYYALAYRIIKEKIELENSNYYWYLFCIVSHDIGKILLKLKKKEEGLKYYVSSIQVIKKLLEDNESIDYLILSIEIYYEYGCLVSSEEENMFLMVEYNCMKVLERTYMFEAVDFLIKKYAKETKKYRYRFDNIITLLERFKDLLDNEYIILMKVQTYMLECSYIYSDFKLSDLDRYSILIDELNNLYDDVDDKMKDKIFNEVYKFNEVMYDNDIDIRKDYHE